MLKTIIIEDEKSAQQLLRMILDEYCPKIKYQGHASTFSEAKDLIDKVNPDVIFLDIALEDCDAFDILDVIDYTQYKIIFTTAYEEHAHKAFRYEAIDYILKPYTSKDVIAALDRVQERDYDKKLLERLSTVLPIKKQSNKIGITTSKGVVIINQDDIVHLEADGSYCKVYTSDDKPILSSKGLKEMESKLSPERFFRIHLSHLVNVEHIKNYIKEDGGTVLLSNNCTVPVSRRRKSDLLERLI